MARLRPDPSFYASAKLAMEAPSEELAYVALLASGDNGRTDALGVVDTRRGSPSYGRLVGQTDLPQGGNELHHFGWNAYLHFLPASLILRYRAAQALTHSARAAEYRNRLAALDRAGASGATHRFPNPGG